MYSLNNLRRRSGRTGLTVAGITLAIALMVVMFSLGNGVRDSAKAILAETGVDIFCQANGTTAHLMLGEIDNGREISLSMIDGNDDIRTAYPVFLHTLFTINETTRQTILDLDPTDIQNLSDKAKKLGPETVTANGVIPELLGDFGGIEVIAGDGFPTETDPFYSDGTYAGGLASPNFTHEMMVNKVMADNLKLKLGDNVYVNTQLPANITQLPIWLANATQFEVVSIIQADWQSLGTPGAFVHMSELQFLAGKTNDTVHQILVDLKDPTKDKEVKKWIEENYPMLEAITIEDFLGEIEEMTAVFRGFGEMILLVTGVIAIMFTATIMIIAIRERMGEIAALRAIGFSKGSIFTTIIVETFIIIMAGFLAGFIIGVPLSLALDNYLIGLSSGEGGMLPAGFHFVTFTPMLLMQMGAVALVFGLVSGLVPAAWAARLNIAETLKKG